MRFSREREITCLIPHDSSSDMQNKEAEKVFFNSFTTDQAYDVFHSRGYQRLVREFIEIVNPMEGESLLDVGCGTGAFINQLKSMLLSVTGIDLSSNSISMALAASPWCSWTVGDAESLPFADKSFDILTFSGILHHLPDLAKILGESRRVLKPGGRVFGYDPNGRNPAMWLYRSPMSPLHSRAGVTVNERLLLAEEVETSLAEAGFTDVACSAISGVSFKYVESSLVKRLLGIYNFMDSCLDKTPLRRRFGTFLISYARKP